QRQVSPKRLRRKLHDQSTTGQ
ncbi:motA/TolQ/ExbB proton channel family protein, partial [Vibrio parahaemolyticus SBR10290]